MQFRPLLITDACSLNISARAHARTVRALGGTCSTVAVEGARCVSASTLCCYCRLR